MRDTLRSTMTLIGFLVVIAILGRVFLFEIVTTESYSMVPTIVAGDTFLVWKHATLDLGDAVVCRNPQEPGSLVVGRITATEGMTIEIRDDSLLINRRILQREFFDNLTYFDRTAGEEQFQYDIAIGQEALGGNIYRVAFTERTGNRNLRERTVTGGHVYLLGDNRNRAQDSRVYGEVPLTNCIGEAFLVVWPADDNGDFVKWDRLPDLVE